MAITPNTTTSGLSSLPSNIMTAAQYKAQQDAAALKSSSSGMGQAAFLTLFTTQLKNQDPLEPVKNEAFVAQLAQFSQLEALTNIQTSMDGFVNSMSAEKLLGSASLIGKRISVADAPSQLSEGGTIDATIDLHGMRHAVHEQQRSESEADQDAFRQVAEDGEEERRHQHRRCRHARPGRPSAHRRARASGR